MVEFKKNIQLTLNDYIAFNNSHNQKFKIKPLFVWIFIFVATTFSYALGLSKDTQTMERSLPFLIFLYVGIFVFIAVAAWIFYFLMKLLSKLLFYLLVKWTYKTKVVTKEQTELTVNENGIQIKTTKMMLGVVWDQVQRITESETTIHIYYSKIEAFIIPKRYFDSIDDFFAFRNFIQSASHKEIVYLPSGKKIMN